MSQLNGIFQPSDTTLWPKLDLNDPETIKDIKSLPADLGSCEDQRMAKEMQMDPNMKMDEPAKSDTAKKPPRR
jgi:hypothetical protein